MTPELEKALRATAALPATGEAAVYRVHVAVLLGEIDRLRAELANKRQPKNSTGGAL
ncbi:hypothetical protein [Streptomyces sp. NPDC020983]|uniref:hypothetical protein n=1 Tax=Streptomyces sp. NPDC020983 TaxID=3365106 RepID=UPI0037938640